MKINNIFYILLLLVNKTTFSESNVKQYSYSPTMLFENAASKGDVNEMENLLKTTDVDVDNQKNYWKTTLLHSNCDKLPTVKFLLENKAQVDAKDRLGQTPLFNVRNVEAMKLFIAKGANVNHKDNNGWTPLHYAVGARGKEVVQELLATGAAVNEQNKYGYTPLHMALCYGSADEIVPVLLQKGADPLIADEQGENALTQCSKMIEKVHESSKQKYTEVLRMLKQAVQDRERIKK